jgi:hypothetical protein
MITVRRLHVALRFLGAAPVLMFPLGACSSTAECEDGLIMTDDGRCELAAPPPPTYRIVGSRPDDAGEMSPGPETASTPPSGGLTSSPPTETGTTCGSGPCAGLIEAITARIAEAAIEAGCDAGPVRHDALSPLVSAHAARNAAADMFLADRDFLGRVATADDAFGQVAAMYSATQGGADDVVARLLEGETSSGYIAACYDAIGVGAAESASGMIWVTIALAQMN